MANRKGTIGASVQVTGAMGKFRLDTTGTVPRRVAESDPRGRQAAFAVRYTGNIFFGQARTPKLNC